ncbi:MAG: hypothetical protein Q9164_001773 [Protoblastenia rupestris]
MKVDIILNQQQDNIETESGFAHWYVVYDKPQILELEVSAEKEDEVGLTVGLVQNLDVSDRVATYAGDVTLSLLPIAGVPCLDATEDEALQPWYNEFCKGQQLPALGGEPIKLTMKDSPGVQVASRAWHGVDGVEQPITQLSVRDKFSLSLWVKKDEERNGVVIKQWDWEYSYAVTPDTSNGGEPNLRRLVVGLHNETQMVETESMKQAIKLDGKVATENPVRQWSPAGWEGRHWPG